MPDDLAVIDEGSLRVDLDRFTFIGSRYTRTAAARLVISFEDGHRRGTVVRAPLGGQALAALMGVSPVGVFAAASACRMTAEEARRCRSHPAKIAAELLDPKDPALPIPGDDIVVELEGLCKREAGNAIA